MAPVGERTALGGALAAAFRAVDVPIVCAYLFGSQARAEAGPLSDVDVAVLFEPSLSPGDRFRMELTLASALERSIRRPVDLVVLNGAPPALAHRAVRDGVVVVSRDDQQRIRFEARVITEYLDLRDVLDRYDAQLLARAREGRLGNRS
jgi:predicted nucleotidyltransferase